MSIGERIRYFRIKRRLTQTELGVLAGFSPENAASRVARFELGTREPSPDVLEQIASALAVSPYALHHGPDSGKELMHLLFELEDRFGLKPTMEFGEPVLRVEKNSSDGSAPFEDCLAKWAEMADLCRQGKMSRERYDTWRYQYPKLDLRRPPRTESGKGQMSMFGSADLPLSGEGEEQFASPPDLPEDFFRGTEKKSDNEPSGKKPEEPDPWP